MNRADVKQLQRVLESRDLRASLQTFLRKASPKKTMKPAKKERLNKERGSRSARNEETARTREACMKRAGGKCECGCGLFFDDRYGPAEMDHFLGGHGRRKQRQSVETCWMLRRDCHIFKTRLSPSSAFWDAKFAAHAERHGYPELTHIEHAAIPRRKVLSASPEARGSPLPEPKATQRGFLPDTNGAGK